MPGNTSCAARLATPCPITFTTTAAFEVGSPSDERLTVNGERDTPVGVYTVCFLSRSNTQDGNLKSGIAISGQTSAHPLTAVG
jgi:hypothetical protein